LVDIDEWLAGVFAPEQLETSVAMVMAALENTDPHRLAEKLRVQDEVKKATLAVKNLTDAIAKGVDPEAVAGPLNAAHGEVLAARARLELLEGDNPTITRKDVEAALGGTWEMAAILDVATDEERSQLYRTLGLRIEINHEARRAKIALDLGKQAVGQSGVGGGT